MLFKSIARSTFHRSGGLRILRHLNRHGARIATYHRFPASGGFLAAHCEHIRQYYRPVSLTELGRRLRSSAPLPARALAVTIDDGYRDFLEFGWPVFRAYGIPVTVFVVTDFLDGKCWLWVDWLQYAFEHARADVLELPARDGQRRRLPLGSAEERLRAAGVVKSLAKGLSNTERLRLLGQMPSLLQTTVPAAPPPEYAPLSWGEVRRLLGEGVEFGAHTKTHPILSRLNRPELIEEVAGSKRRVEEETGAPVLHFCYPNGGPHDFDSEVVEVVEREGLQTSVTMLSGLNFPGENPFALKRLGVESELPELLFHEYLAGFRLP